MTDQTKTAPRVAAPDAVEDQKSKVIIVGNLGRVNDQEPVQAMRAAGLEPHKPLDIRDDGRVHRY